MHVLFYGKLADSFGETVEMKLSKSCTIAELRERLEEHVPAAKGALGGRVRACVGDRIVEDSHVVGPQDRVEFLAPVSGG